MNGKNCPYCNSDRIFSDLKYAHRSHNRILDHVMCDSCGNKWDEMYELSAVLHTELADRIDG